MKRIIKLYLSYMKVAAVAALCASLLLLDIAVVVRVREEGAINKFVSFPVYLIFIAGPFIIIYIFSFYKLYRHLQNLDRTPSSKSNEVHGPA